MGEAMTAYMYRPWANTSPQPWELMDAIVSFRRLSRLVIHVYVPVEASELSAKYRQNAMGSVPMPQLRWEKINDIVSNMFGTMLVLQNMELHFQRLVLEDRAQQWMAQKSARIRRAEGDDAPELQDSGFVIEWDAGWMSM